MHAFQSHLYVVHVKQAHGCSKPLRIMVGLATCIFSSWVIVLGAELWELLFQGHVGFFFFKQLISSFFFSIQDIPAGLCKDYRDQVDLFGGVDVFSVVEWFIRSC